jgi:Zn-dependent peptidase ImmA (M78 family)
MNSGAIEDLARKRLIDFWESRGKPDVVAFFPVDAQALIRTVLGWECEAKDMVAVSPGFNVLGRCSIGKNGRQLVEVATQEIVIGGTWSDEAVQRWTWAHEAGHIVLSHIDPEKKVYECRRVRSAIRPREQRCRGPEEMTADVFARALLMPEKAVRDRFKQSFQREQVWATRSAYVELLQVTPPNGTEINAESLAEELATRRDGSGVSMCDFFGVSKAAARRRLTELRLVFS